jgi:hypothetical protein
LTQDEIVHSDARRFWATYPDTAARKEYVTRILLTTERSRRRKKREKQKLAPYKIYSLRHS